MTEEYVSIQFQFSPNKERNFIRNECPLILLIIARQQSQLITQVHSCTMEFKRWQQFYQLTYAQHIHTHWPYARTHAKNVVDVVKNIS